MRGSFYRGALMLSHITESFFPPNILKACNLQYQQITLLTTSNMNFLELLCSILNTE